MSPPCAYLVRPSSSSTSTPFRPEPLVSPPLLPSIDQSVHQQKQNRLHRFQINISRRLAIPLLCAALVLFLCEPDSAEAWSINFVRTLTRVRKQGLQKKEMEFLSPVIDAWRDSLNSAHLLLRDFDNGDMDVEKVQKLLKSAASGWVAGQAKTGVEVCIFLKDASSKLDDKDSQNCKAKASVDNLMSSFTSLNVTAKETDVLFPPNRQKVANALMGTISSLNNFKEGIKNCMKI